jgi:hypothetical protein
VYICTMQNEINNTKTNKAQISTLKLMIESYYRSDSKIKYDQFCCAINPQQLAAATRLYIKASNFAKKIGISETEYQKLICDMKPMDNITKLLKVKSEYVNR